jgi:hypothetical protein
MELKTHHILFRIAELWADIIFDVLDNVFAFPSVEHMDPMHLDDVLQDVGQQAHDATSTSPAPLEPIITVGQRSIWRKAMVLYNTGAGLGR